MVEIEIDLLNSFYIGFCNNYTTFVTEQLVVCTTFWDTLQKIITRVIHDGKISAVNPSLFNKTLPKHALQGVNIITYSESGWSETLSINLLPPWCSARTIQKRHFIKILTMNTLNANRHISILQYLIFLPDNWEAITKLTEIFLLNYEVIPS